jgi:hypothetical protein
MEWQREHLPPDGTWCWVTDGNEVWMAVRDDGASYDWSNGDTWADWDNEVVAWIPLEKPELS